MDVDAIEAKAKAERAAEQAAQNRPNQNPPSPNRSAQDPAAVAKP